MFYFSVIGRQLKGRKKTAFMSVTEILVRINQKHALTFKLLNIYVYIKQKKKKKKAG